MFFNGEKFSELVKKKGLTTAEMISILKDRYDIEITIDTMKSYRRKKGGVRTPPIDKLIAFSEILGVSVDELSRGEKVSSVNFVPVIGNASCGAVEISSLQDMSRRASYNGNLWKESLYCVIANGDSMSPEIDDGDEVIIDPEVKPITGDIVYYKLDNEAAIKVLVEDTDAYILQFIPYNQTDNFKIRTVRIDDEETMDRLIIHKVVSVNKLKFNNRAARLKMIGR